MQVGTCSGPGSFAKVYVEMQVATGSAWKYDLGVYFRLDTPSNTVLNSTVTAANVGLSGSCVAATLPPSLGDDDGDTCGDLNGRATCVVRKALNVSCVNLLGGTDVTVPVCMVWASTSSSVCAVSGLLPSPSTSCACTVVTIKKMAVSGVGALYGNLYAPANSIFTEDGSAGGPAPPAPPVGAPVPSLPWCAGKPRFNWGTSSGSQGSCPGDAWNAWGGSPLYPVQCVSQDLDVSFTIPTLQHRQIKACSGPGSTGSAYVAISASATLVPAVMRYNLGTYIRTDTPANWSGPINAAGVYGTCVQEVLGASGPGMVDMDGDGCGDLNRTQSPISACVLTQMINFTCVDLDNDGNVNLPVCMTWSTARTDCRTAGMIPSSRSKCVCTSVNLVGMPVYGGPDQSALIQPSAPTPSGTPPVVWPPAAPPPPPLSPPPRPPGIAPACPAANMSLQNGGFELPANGGGTVPQTSMIGWRANASDGMVELLAATGIAFEGSQYAEACATTKCNTLYQDVTTTPGAMMYWQLQHRGRYGVDVTNLTLGAPNGVPSLVVPMSDGTMSWQLYSGCVGCVAQLHIDCPLRLSPLPGRTLSLQARQSRACPLCPSAPTDRLAQLTRCMAI